MKCPHCAVHFYENWVDHYFLRHGSVVVDGQGVSWQYRSANCPECGNVTIEVASFDDGNWSQGGWWKIHPMGANRGPVPTEVPKSITGDYIEACRVLPISAKASAALSRRCLQMILHANGYEAPDLAKEIDLLLNESDPRKALPRVLRETVDGVRNFGNFSAHPIDDKTTLQVIDVEPHEAEWCLEIIENLFEHFYVGPALAKAKKDALNEKLLAAGKKPAK